jgi:polysaccharide export outer membrane protein
MLRVILALVAVVWAMTGSAIAQTVHSGDMLEISVYQDPKLDRRVIVGPDGTIGFPLAGHIKAAGRTLESIEGALKDRLQKNYTEPLNITVSLASVSSDQEEASKPRVYVTGEVLRPGPYTILRRTNVMQALTLAGGVGPFAAVHRIQIHRRVNGVDSIFLFDYKGYQAGTDAAENIALHSGDVVIVPERGLFE